MAIKNSNDGMMDTLRNTWAEIKKVHFPTRAETIQSSIGVLALMLLFAVFLGLTDHLVGQIMRGILT